MTEGARLLGSYHGYASGSSAGFLGDPALAHPPRQFEFLYLQPDSPFYQPALALLPNPSVSRQFKGEPFGPLLREQGERGLSTLHNHTTLATGGCYFHLEGEKGVGGVFGARRGDVKGFSRDSRRRLMRLLSQIDRDEAGLPEFLTLTYPASWPTDGQIVKRHLNLFQTMLCRAFPKCWGVWRLEYQERGAPHFHIMLWHTGADQVAKWAEANGDLQRWQHKRHKDGKHERWLEYESVVQFRRVVRLWLSGVWFAIVRSGDLKHLRAGTNWEGVRSWNGVAAYCSKYLAKIVGSSSVPEDVTNCGRFWGRIGSKRFCIDLYEADIPLSRVKDVRRLMRKLLERRTGKRIRSRKVPTGFTVFLKESEALKVLMWAWADGGDDDDGVVRGVPDVRKDGGSYGTDWPWSAGGG